MDVLLLSRLQFALTIMFHYLFPPLTIGLSLVIVYLLAMHLRTRDAIYETAARFWVRIFGLNFALGVATGIVMEFEFGTNWAVYSRYVGDAADPLALKGRRFLRARAGLFRHLGQELLIDVIGDHLGERAVAGKRIAAKQTAHGPHNGDVFGIGLRENDLERLVVFGSEEGERRGQRAGRYAGDEIELRTLA